MGGAVGRDILANTRVSLGHGEIANVDELVKPGATAKENLGAKVAMAGNHDVIGEDVVVPDFDVMGEVGDGHDEVAVADDGVAAWPGAAVNGDVFADGVAVSNENTGFGGGVKAEILWQAANDRAVFDSVVCAHDDTSADFGV